MSIVDELRAEVIVPYREGYEPFRAPPSKLMTDAADEIERVTRDFQQVHHNCVHAREVADKALALLKEVPVSHMPVTWQDRLIEVTELARAVPPRTADKASEGQS